MLGFGKKDDDDKKDDADQAKVSQAMRQMSDQIAQMQQTINARDAEIADLKKKLGTAQADDKSDDARVQAAETKVKTLEAEVARLKTAAAAATASSQAKSSAPAPAAAPAPAPAAAAPSGLHVGGAAWVRKAGGKGLRRRSAPGLSSQVQDSFEPGTLLALLEGPRPADDYTWWRVVSNDDRTGWVAGEELVTKPE